MTDTKNWQDMSTEERKDEVRRLANEHLSVSDIAASIPGATRNGVIGLIWRSRATSAPIRLWRLPNGVGPTNPRKLRPAGLSRQVLDAFLPLPGSAPVPLFEVNDKHGCRWPVTVDGKTLFCNEHAPYREDRLIYCPTHMAMRDRTP